MKEKKKEWRDTWKLTSQLIDDFDDVRFEQIPRENNPDVDEVTKLASTEDAPKKPRLYMEIQTIPSIKGLQAFSVQQSNTWMDPILS